IPVLNEADNLPNLIQQLQQQLDCHVEIIVVDGGSIDQTQKIVKNLGVVFVTSKPGRGVQMNTGAKVAKAPILLFLHGDSTLTNSNLLSNAIASLYRTRQTLGHDRIGGHFKLKFVEQPANRQWVFKFYEAKTALNRPQCTNGDQGFLLSREFFFRLGGFSQELPFLEDQILASKIYETGVWITLPGSLTTSARRFKQEGLGRRMILNAIIMALHYTGFKEFFTRAPEVYRQQDSTEPLQISPFFKLIKTIHSEANWQGSFKHWLYIGAFVRGAAWQIFFLFDVIVAQIFNWQKKPFLTFHDRFFKPITNYLPFDLLTAILTWIWFTLTGYYFVIYESTPKWMR
ncbi:MAG: TIGR04283 family arsenosugar biosynthesis glycosyltransferase, partial [Magnetococcales bacterium]|nr:TIGR04283 family arsenosugar biosynthesis glycosyltransferase [Magnetococcales bacterium]